jgi:hypothetical protein
VSAIGCSASYCLITGHNGGQSTQRGCKCIDALDFAVRLTLARRIDMLERRAESAEAIARDAAKLAEDAIAEAARHLVRVEVLEATVAALRGAA